MHIGFSQNIGCKAEVEAAAPQGFAFEDDSEALALQLFAQGAQELQCSQARGLCPPDCAGHFALYPLDRKISGMPGACRQPVAAQSLGRTEAALGGSWRVELERLSRDWPTGQQKSKTNQAND
jgi:hypothetical protein